MGKSYAACRGQLPFMSRMYIVTLTGSLAGVTSASAGNSTVMGVAVGEHPWQAGVSGGGGMAGRAASTAAAIDSRVLSSPAQEGAGPGSDAGTAI